MSDAGQGAAAPEITVEYNGQSISIPKPAGLYTEAEVKERYVPKAAHNAEMGRFRKELDSRKDWASPDDLLQNADFRAKAVEVWGLDATKSQAQFQEQLAKTRAELQERELKPLAKKLETAEQRVQRLRQKDLHGQIVQAAATAKVDDRYLKPAIAGGTPLIVSMLREGFDFDEQHDEWFAKGQSGFQFSQSGESPYMRVQEFVKTWVASDGKDYVRPERQQGAESKPAAQPGVSGGVMYLKPEEFTDVTVYRRKKAEAAAKGLEIRPAPTA